jgi:hypothetical protein
MTHPVATARFMPQPRNHWRAVELEYDENAYFIRALANVAVAGLLAQSIFRRHAVGIDSPLRAQQNGIAAPKIKFLFNSGLRRNQCRSEKLAKADPGLCRQAPTEQ